MQAFVCDSCKKVVTDIRKRYSLQINRFCKDLCEECFNKLKDTFFKDPED